MQGPANLHVFGSILSFMAILLFVQVQMAGPSPHSVSLCDKESFALHYLQIVVSVKFIAARRSHVGKMSWMTAYHADRTSSGARDSSRFCHTWSHFTSSCLWSIRITGGVFPAASIRNSVSYIRFLNVRVASVRVGGSMYVISRAYCSR